MADITTEQGQQEASMGKSPLSLYLQRMGKMPGEAMEKIYGATVDGSCLSCEQEQLLTMMTCREPLSFFPFVDETREEVEVVPIGAYSIPTSCEYCGAESTKLCDETTCQRPKLYFRKKRPPFDPAAEQYDPVTEYRLPPPPPTTTILATSTDPTSSSSSTTRRTNAVGESANKSKQSTSQAKSSTTSWVAGLFGSHTRTT